jgi:hypothetical protein
VSPPPDFDQNGRSSLDAWHTTLGDDPVWAGPDFDHDTHRGWSEILVPHNHENYHGYALESHGNLHGTAWYRCCFYRAENDDSRHYVFFEGVGSYATVYCNGIKVGSHAGGRTTFTVDISPALCAGRNVIALRAHHPEKIDDLPFVCGGCWGSPNTEGSQPFGLFRPAWLERTGPVRVTPFGVHILTPELSRKSARIQISTELHNPGTVTREIVLHQTVIDPDGKVWQEHEQFEELKPGELREVCQEFPLMHAPRLWEPDDPCLYRVISRVTVAGEVSHQVETTFGLRWLDWPVIQDPEADHNVRSPDRRGRMICNGRVEREAGNNGLTRILEHDGRALVGLAPMGAVIMLDAERSVDDEMGLAIHLDFIGEEAAEAVVFCEIQNEGGTVFIHQNQMNLMLIEGKESLVWQVPRIHHPHLWSQGDPYLHRLLIEIRSPEGILRERSETLFGLCQHDGPLNLERPKFEPIESALSAPNLSAGHPIEKRLLINGKPVFLNGTCEYENLLGCDHAFTDEQIAASVAMIRAAGFNAFRDAHHPHNLRYSDHWDRAGIVCWTQMGSRIWFDNPRFRQNYKQLVTEWVRERRNHPSVILWGLQNESVLPADFARELRDIIRQLDPTSPSSRLVTTCNGGKGSDWNVPQEWSGTYGGNCHDYDLESLQLVGEYGAWRRLGVHQNTVYRGDENDRTETWAAYALETKIRLGEAVRDRAIGHFQWIFNTFANPGRSASSHEGPDNARIGPVNNKGLVTSWHQPSDLFYLYQSNYADSVREPMVYIVSHTWPGRWREPGPQPVSVYSNCDEVELFNGVGSRSLGVRHNPGRGRHFQWEDVIPETAVLYAEGRVRGEVVVRDLILLEHLPADSSLTAWLGDCPQVKEPEPGKMLYRVSCGSEFELQNVNGDCWQPDQIWDAEADWGWESWASAYTPRMNADTASRGATMTPTRGSATPELFRAFRFGRDALKYHFRVQPGTYHVRLHFVEPWFGIGSAGDCTGWRLFDVAVNGEVLERDLDIWAEAGGDHRALGRTYAVEVAEDILTVEFPYVRVNQALICGIEVFA